MNTLDESIHEIYDARVSTGKAMAGDLFFNLEGRQIGDWKVLRLVPRQSDLWRCLCKHCQDESTLTTVELRSKEVPECSCQYLTLARLQARSRELKRERQKKATAVLPPKPFRVGVHRHIPEAALNYKPPPPQATPDLISAPLRLVPKQATPVVPLELPASASLPRSRTPEYMVWKRLAQGTERPLHPAWANSFEAFLEAVGTRPDVDYHFKLIDRAGTYEPGNCQWVRMERDIDGTFIYRPLTLKVDGKEITHSLSVWARIVGIGRTRLAQRLDQSHWTLLDALATPVKYGSGSKPKPYNPEIFINRKFGSWIVIALDPDIRDHVLCQCIKCGQTKSVYYRRVKRLGHKDVRGQGCKSCTLRAYHRQKWHEIQGDDLTTKRFGILRVIGYGGTRDGTPYWRCRCACTRIIIAPVDGLESGTVRDCGCISRGTLNVVGETATYRIWHEMTPEYKAWNKAKSKAKLSQGTANPIIFYEGWQEFEYFLEDLGMKTTPDDALRRYDRSLGYVPGNCYWQPLKFTAPRGQQISLTIEIDGEEITQGVREWSARSGIAPNAIRSRLAKGWTPERAVFAPSHIPSVKYRCIDRTGLERDLTVSAWAKEYSLPASALRNRMAEGDSIAEAIQAATAERPFGHAKEVMPLPPGLLALVQKTV